jgi:hypothetical protein
MFYMHVYASSISPPRLRVNLHVHLTRSCDALKVQLIGCTYSHSDYCIDPLQGRAQTYTSTAVNAVKSCLR